MSFMTEKEFALMWCRIQAHRKYLTFITNHVLLERNENENSNHSTLKIKGFKSFCLYS